MSPYRVRPEHRAAPPAADGCPDADLFPVAAIVWLGSIARSWLAVAHREPGGAESTLAILCAAGLPLLFKPSAAWLWRRVRRGARSRVAP
jgi:hypothetical protein